jgi:hypothetical protein
MSLSNPPAPTDFMGPWTIKSFAINARQGIVRDAEIAGVTVGQFIERMYAEWKADGPKLKVDEFPAVVLARLLVESAANEGIGLTQWLERHVPEWRSDRGRTALQTWSTLGGPAASDYSPLEELERLKAIDPTLTDDTVLQRRLRRRARQISVGLSKPRGKSSSKTRKTPSDQPALDHPEVRKWVEPEEPTFQNGFAAIQAAESET